MAIQVDGVLDIEVESWTVFVAGGLLTRKGYVERGPDAEERYVDDILECDGQTLWAHNGGKFDFLWFIKHLSARGIRAYASGTNGRITCLKIVDGPTLRDSFALVPFALEKGARIGRYEKTSTSLPCRCGEECGGYCSIRRRMTAAELRQLMEYLHNDCRATLSMLDTLVDYCEANQIELAGTIGGTAWKTAVRELDLPPADWSQPLHGISASSLYAYVKKSDFGGRTQMFRPEAWEAYRYDIVSSYPAALSKVNLPVGRRTPYDGPDAEKAWKRERDGVFSADIWIPECHIPPLPVRDDIRLSYPFGKLRGTWTANELRYAETCGARIQRIRRGLVWSTREVVFSSLCDRIWKLRDAAGSSTALGTWIKWLSNSITGRLGIRPDAESYVIGRGSDHERPCPANFRCRGICKRGKCCAHRCSKRCGKTVPLGEFGREFGIWVRHRWHIPESAHLHYAAYLKAHARVELHQELTCDADGYESIYCDTDSCFSLVEKTRNVGTELGQFKRERPIVPYYNEIDDSWEPGFVGLGPKTYSENLEGHSEKPGKKSVRTNTGEREVRSKGVDNTVQNFERLMRGEKVQMNRGVESLRAAVRKGHIFTRRELSRRFLDTTDANGIRWYGDRYLGPDGATHPKQVNQW